MSIVRAGDRRESTTPNGAMTTCASPTLGGASLSLWRVAMAPGARGPAHRFDGEQVWTVLHGRARLEVDGTTEELDVGDTAVVGPGVARQWHADPALGLEAMVAAPAGIRASMLDGTDRGVPPWIA